MLFRSDLRTDTLLFSQTGGFVLEVDADNVDFVKTVFSDSGVFADVIGRTTNSERIRIQEVIDIPVSKAKPAWENGLREKL